MLEQNKLVKSSLYIQSDKLKLNRMKNGNKDNTKIVSEKKVVPVIKEELVVGKKKVETGKVTVEKKVSEKQVSLDVELTGEIVAINRIEKNENIDRIPQIKTENGVTIIPVVKEQIVTYKQLVLVEEIHITKKISKTSETVAETVKEEKIYIKRESLD